MLYSPPQKSSAAVDPGQQLAGRRKAVAGAVAGQVFTGAQHPASVLPDLDAHDDRHHQSQDEWAGQGRCVLQHVFAG